ncbi:unnamed protein product [Amoebophrya sp. A120]|nr:unnamed protein product [Amoebophrya sp. A120]|eukprot:GSA120T00018437001.1
MSASSTAPGGSSIGSTADDLNTSSGPSRMVSLEQTRGQVQTATDTLKQSMQQMVARDGQLRGLDNKSATLNSTAGQFSQSSRQLQQKMMLRQYFLYFLCALLFIDAVAYVLFSDSYWTVTFMLVLVGAGSYFAMNKYKQHLESSSASSYVEFADDRPVFGNSDSGGGGGTSQMGNQV